MRSSPKRVLFFAALLGTWSAAGAAVAAEPKVEKLFTRLGEGWLVLRDVQITELE